MSLQPAAACAHVDAAIVALATALQNLTDLRRSMGAPPPGGVPGRAWEVMSEEVPPPVRPPPVKATPVRGRPKTGAQRTADWRERQKQKREQGCHPAPSVVDSPEQTYCDSQPYTTPAAPSTTQAGEAAACVILDTSGTVTRDAGCDAGDVTRDESDVTERHGQGVFKEFSTTTTENNLPPKAPPSLVTSPTSLVTSHRAAPRAQAAHEVRQPRERAGKGGRGAVTVTGDAPRDAAGSRGGESALTPDGSVAPGHSLRDAMCALFAEVMRGKRYDWRDEDDKAVRAILVRAGNDTDEVLLRWRIALRTRFPRCRSVRKLLQEWNEYAAPDLEPDAPQHAPAPQLEVGRSTARSCDCAVHGCGGPGLAAWGQSLCLAHFDAMERDVGKDNLSEELAAAWLEGQNAEEAPCPG